MSMLRLSQVFGFRQTMLLTAGCFVVVTLAVTGVALLSRSYARQGSRQTQTLTREFLPGLVTLSKLQAAALDAKCITFQFALAKNEAGMNAQQAAFDATTEQIRRHVAELKQLASDRQTNDFIATFEADEQRAGLAAEKFFAELHDGAFEPALLTLDQEIAPAQKLIEDHLNTLGEHYYRRSHDASSRTTELLAQSDRVGLLATIILAGFILLCLGLSIAATLALLKQVQRRDDERLAAQATLEKRVEKRTAALRASEERIRLIVDTASDAIISFDQAGAIIAWNAQAETIFGWTAAEAMGRNFAETILAPTHRELHHQRLTRFLASGDGTELRQRIEAVCLHRDGHTVLVEVSLSPIRRDGTVVISAFIHDIAARRRAEIELKDLHQQLLETSRQAGMAEVATGVLHNVGNALNSVNVSATLVTDRIAKSKTAQLVKIAEMLEAHRTDLVRFLTEDPKGQRIPHYLITLSADLTAEQTAACEELQVLHKNIEHIKDIVSMQQSYAKVSGITEQLPASTILEDALRINASALVRHGLDVVRDYQADPTITTERHKALQVMVNLIHNAKYACDESGLAAKRVTLRITTTADRVHLSVEDNGIGIPAENLTRIFAHGFTTRKNGHGFGLHSSALVAKELGGALTVHSDGPGHGAIFTLDLPLTPATAPSS